MVMSGAMSVGYFGLISALMASLRWSMLLAVGAMGNF
jgi:hypothetical protein